MVARVRFGELGEFPVVPFEVTGIDDHTSDRIAMTVDVLCSGKDNNIDTVLDRAHKPDTGGVVDHEGDSRIMGDLCYGFKIRDIKFRVPDGLGIDSPGLWGDCLLECLGFGRVHEDDMSPEFGERIMEQLIGPAVQVVCGNDLVAYLGDIQERIGDCCLARCCCNRTVAAFDCRNAFLEHVRGRVHEPGIDIAQLAEAEQVRCVLGTLEDV